MASSHLPVLLHEAIEALQLREDGCYLDATFGRGGHSRAILSRLGSRGRLWGLDQDPDAFEAAKALEAHDGRFRAIHANFGTCFDEWSTSPLPLKWDGVLMDLGVSSPQLDVPHRGFSFMREGPLDMRMNPTASLSASEWLQQVSEEDLARVLWQYGEERFSKRIARAVVETQQREGPFKTTTALSACIEAAIPRMYTTKHPATRSFQAIRMHLNQEIAMLESALAQWGSWIQPRGRLVVIAFHSLEDRCVKQHRDPRPLVESRLLPGEAPPARKPWVQLGKAIFPSEKEVAHNPRSRSAVLRVLVPYAYFTA